MHSSARVLGGAFAGAALLPLAWLAGCSPNAAHDANNHQHPALDADAAVSLSATPDDRARSRGDAAVTTATQLARDAAAPRPNTGPVANSGGPSANDGDDAATPSSQAADAATPPTLADLPYAAHVDRFTPGPNAGFGQAKYPDVVLGPPKGTGTRAGSLDVLSLGVGGEIVLDFGDRDLVDGPGPDFIVFENPFWPGGDPKQVFAEPGEVSVSEDGTSWHTFACDPAGDGMGHYPGCAGWTPTLVYDASAVIPLDPSVTGGDAFDLAELGLARAHYVRIRDLSTSGEGNTAGFDLDAIGLIYEEPTH